jgi:hypothetical protein
MMYIPVDVAHVSHKIVSYYFSSYAVFYAGLDNTVVSFIPKLSSACKLLCNKTLYEASRQYHIYSISPLGAFRAGLFTVL